MTTQWQLRWRNLFLTLTVLPCCRSIQVSIQEAEYEAARGGDIVMTCSFIPANPVLNTLIITWEAYPDNLEDSLKPVATFFINNPIDIAPQYEGRASLEVDTNGYISKLSLKKVTMQDSRRYQCSVRIPGDDEGTLAATTSLLVLVPPSPPICKIQGTAEYWQNISLTCQSEEGSPKPVPEWKLFSVENIPKPFPPKTTEKDGVLSLFNISIETSGFYICTSTNRIGSASCNLTLAVMPGSMNIGSTAAIIGGVLAGVVLLGIIIFCCCRKKGKNEDNVEDSPAKVFYDRDAPEVGEKYLDEKPNRDTKQSNQKENKDKPKFEDDQHGNSSGEEGHVQERDTDSQRYQYDQENPHRGSRDRLDDKPNHYGGSRDRLDDKRDHYGGSRDRLDDRRDHYGGSRDRLDDRRDHYGGSRDRLDDRRDRYGGSRDRLDDRRDRYGGSRDRLD